jgi:hypothetical protein
MSEPVYSEPVPAPPQLSLAGADVTTGVGREVLSFIEGEVAGRPGPCWVLDDSVLHRVGTLLRRLHEAHRILRAREWLRVEHDRLWDALR